jgi:hypothetical protein
MNFIKNFYIIINYNMIKKKFTYKNIKTRNNKNTKKQKNIYNNKRFKVKKSKKRKIYKKSYKKSYKKKITKKFKKKYLQNGGDAASDAVEAANKKNQEWQAERAAAAQQAADQASAGNKSWVSSAKNILKNLTDSPVGAGAVQAAQTMGTAVGEGAAAVVGGDIISKIMGDAIAEKVENTTMPCAAQAPGFKQSLISIACSLFEDMGLSMARHGVGGQAVGSMPANDNAHPT